MSQIALWGALESGIIYSFVALGVYISFRILEFPDLTVDGSFPLGAAVTAILIVSGVNPWIATIIAVIAGATAGITTASLHVYWKILPLLASILVMIALYSVNLRIMGKPNIALLGDKTILSFLENIPIPHYMSNTIFLLILLIVFFVLLFWFFNTQLGLRLRSTGSNQKMSNAQGVNTNFSIILGMAISNGLVALAGALFAQSQGIADVSLGIGTIVIGLAAVIGGEAIIPNRTVLLSLLGCVIGALLYRLAVAFALHIDFAGIKAQDLNLLTAVLVTIAIIFPQFRKKKNRND